MYGAKVSSMLVGEFGRCGHLRILATPGQPSRLPSFAAYAMDQDQVPRRHIFDTYGAVQNEQRRVAWAPARLVLSLPVRPVLPRFASFCRAVDLL